MKKSGQGSLVSVVVPVYMVDQYVGLCIESILNQTYRELEIILVDDGGRDRCHELCDLYASKDERIRVIHKPNGGLVSARKAGVQESNGAYVAYVDGDDWIGPGFIESLYTAAKTSEADMVCAGFTRELFSRSSPFVNTLPTGLYEGEKLHELWKTMLSVPPFYRPGISTYVWNKLFKREILLAAQSRVDSRISLGEDGAVTYPALLACSRVAVIDNVAYHYRQREDSMLKQRTDYAQDAQKLLWLYEYLTRWADGTPAAYGFRAQVQDYVLANAIMRSGGRVPNDDFSTFDTVYYGKDVVIYSAGTFGQQLVNRFRETKHCRVVAWLDDDYWEYRRCCLNVDPVESITALRYDYVLIATVDRTVSEGIRKRLLDLGVSGSRILETQATGDREQLLQRFLDVEAIRAEEAKRKRGIPSHA